MRFSLRIGVSPTSWVMSSATCRRERSIVVFCTLQVTEPARVRQSHQSTQTCVASMKEVVLSGVAAAHRAAVTKSKGPQDVWANKTHKGILIALFMDRKNSIPDSLPRGPSTALPPLRDGNSPHDDSFPGEGETKSTAARAPARDNTRCGCGLPACHIPWPWLRRGWRDSRLQFSGSSACIRWCTGFGCHAPRCC